VRFRGFVVLGWVWFVIGLTVLVCWTPIAFRLAAQPFEDVKTTGVRR